MAKVASAVLSAPLACTSGLGLAPCGTEPARAGGTGVDDWRTMSHNLEILADGTASFVSVRTPAWHRLGIVWPEELSPIEALRLARADYEVRTVPIYGFADGKIVSSERGRMTVRDDPDTGRPVELGVVTASYEPYQNAEAFVAFAQTLLDADLRAETCGVLGKGERAFMSFRLPKEILVAGRDRVGFYLLILNSHDGSSSLVVSIGGIRPVCQNTINAHLSSALRKWATRHTRNIRSRIEDARRALEVSYAYAEEFEALANSLAASSMSGAEFEEYLAKLWPMPDGAEQATVTRVEKVRSQVTDLYRVAKTQEGFRNTKWAAYNAVVEYLDHYRPVRAGAAAADDARAVAVLTDAATVVDKKDRALALLSN